MNTVAKILGNKLFALAGVVSVGISLLVVPAFTGGLGANPLEKLLHQSGEIAIWTLGAVLALSPLRVLLPRSRIVAALNRHRRAIGVSACIYGLLHFGFHVLYEGGWDGLMRSLSKPFIWFGLTGLSILVVLALTSNNWSIRTLGGKNWKLLHRLAYVAAAVLIYHQAIAGKGHWAIARWLLFPLVTLQLARLIKILARERHPYFASAAVLSAAAKPTEGTPVAEPSPNRPRQVGPIAIARRQSCGAGLCDGGAGPQRIKNHKAEAKGDLSCRSSIRQCAL